MAIRELVYDLTHPLLGAVARNRWLIKRLFDVRVPCQIPVHFDPTTVGLRLALKQAVTPDDRTALEVGIGQGALLAIGLQKSTDLDVQGVDCSEERVESSNQVALHNGLEAHFFCSDLFGGVPAGRQFDLIFFNPPYVPTSQGKRLKLTRNMRADTDRVWDGGEDGSLVLRSFLEQAHTFLTEHGRVLFGVQPVFLPSPCVEEIVRETGWIILDRITRCCLPCVTFVLGHPAGDSSAQAPEGNHPASR